MASDTPETTEKKRRSLKPLARLMPYLARYKGLVTGALISLVLAAVTTLAIPMAVRRMIDHGFSDGDTDFISQYCSMLSVIAGVMAAASATR